MVGLEWGRCGKWLGGVGFGWKGRFVCGCKNWDGVVVLNDCGKEFGSG